jgi:hypothetical protein
MALALLFIAPGAMAAQTATGFVTYRVTASLPTGQHSAVVNESVRPSDRVGFSDLILQLAGGQQNLTYSRLVNDSVNLFPYLPTLAAQSLDYQNGTRYSVHVNFSSGGTASVSFQGSQYQLAVYTISVAGSYGGMHGSLNGTVETFPSSLVYSATVNGEMGIKVQAVLLATDLPLTQPSSQTAAAAYVGAGIGAGGIALAAALFVRRKERKAQPQEQKPLHWVD